MTCPNRNVLLAFRTGELSETAAEEVIPHLSVCSDCQATLQTFGDAEDTFIAKLRSPAAADPYADEPERAAVLLALHEDAMLDLVRQMAEAGVRVMMSMDNLDTFFHPPHYVEQYSASYYEKAARICHEHGSLFFIHACGRQRGNLKLIASLGVDGLEGVAFPPLGDVELDEALALAGDRFIVTGGISAKEFQLLQTREDIFAYVKKLFDRLRPQAHRFIFSASCNTPYTAPWEKIVHFRDAWREYGACH